MATSSSTAFIKDIVPNGPDGVHSVSPSWVLTFIRWENRNLQVSNTGDAGQISYFLATRDPLVVESDCASVSVSYSKGSHTPSMQAMLYAGDINYSTAVAPGDFVFVNMLNWDSEARRVGINASSSKPINRVEDGFKGFFKVQSVRRVLAVDPASGKKKIMFQVSAFGFTEFNNTLYFNPFLIGSEANNQFLFVTRISQIWEQYVGKKGTFTVQNILRLLIDSTIGSGFKDNDFNQKKNGLELTQNTHFYIPDKVGALLGQPNAKAAKDVYNYLFGIQEYVSGTNSGLSSGMNPVVKNREGRYILTPKECQGASLLKPEYWNQTAVWSILNQYTNSPINELFTTLRVDPDGAVMPTLVFRQIPFSSQSYQGTATRFLNIPRWRVDPNLLLDVNIGREEAARINFVQVFASVQQASDQTNQGLVSQQIAAGNFVVDDLDIRRSGLKPYIVTSNFDEIVTDKKASNAPQWAKLLADATFGSHLKLNGSIQVQGIVEPIAVGDNLELDGTVYHIEGVSHTCSVQPNGFRSFKTNIEMSHGIDLSSARGPKIFSQMRNPNMQDEVKEDYNNNRILPTFSDEQAIRSRLKNQNFGKDTSGNKGFSSSPGTPPPARRPAAPKNKKKETK